MENYKLEKYWKLECTNAEICIIKIAVEKYVQQYTNFEFGAFTKEELDSALLTVNYPEHRSL